MKTALPALGSPGTLISAAAPPAPPAPTVAGMSLSVTSTVPPSDSRKATSAHTSERFSAIGGLSTAGMIGGPTPPAGGPGGNNDPTVVALARLPGLPVPARAPSPAPA